MITAATVLLILLSIAFGIRVASLEVGIWKSFQVWALFLSIQAVQIVLTILNTQKP